MTGKIDVRVAAAQLPAPGTESTEPSSEEEPDEELPEVAELEEVHE